MLERLVVALLGLRHAPGRHHRDLDRLDAVALVLQREQVERPACRHLDAVAALEETRVPLIVAVEHAATGAHRRHPVAVLAALAGGRIARERRARTGQRRRVHPPLVVPDLLHQHGATGAGVVPGVALRPGHIALRSDAAPVAGRHLRSEVPHVMVVRALDHRLHGGLEAAVIAGRHRVAERPLHVAAHLQDPVRDLVVDGGEGRPGVEDGRRRRGVGDVRSAAHVDDHEHSGLRLGRRADQRRRHARLVGRHHHEARRAELVAQPIAPHADPIAGGQGGRGLGHETEAQRRLAGAAYINEVVPLAGAVWHVGDQRLDLAHRGAAQRRIVDPGCGIVFTTGRGGEHAGEQEPAMTNRTRPEGADIHGGPSSFDEPGLAFKLACPVLSHAVAKRPAAHQSRTAALE